MLTANAPSRTLYEGNVRGSMNHAGMKYVPPTFSPDLMANVHPLSTELWPNKHWDPVNVDKKTFPLILC